MKITLMLLLIISSLSLTGCQASYLLKNSWHQSKILKSRIPVDDVIKDPKTPDEIKRKLQLIQQARTFASSQLGLAASDNYTSYVDLKRNYVTWVVRASPKWELKPYQWWFPITGHVPYKGYFTEESAKSEATDLKEKGYDTYVRGVSAYSTLGWFEDPVLNTMMRYKDYDLVNLIIHETVHATLFIKSNVDFNERLATFIGNLGAERFYQNRDNGEEILEQVKKENQDLAVFSAFITKELSDLKQWYKENGNEDLETRTKRFEAIQSRFTEELSGKLKTDRFKYFESLKLNNAVLLSYETYQANLDLFHKLYEKLGQDFKAFIEFCKELETSDDPEARIRHFVNQE